MTIGFRLLLEVLPNQIVGYVYALDDSIRLRLVPRLGPWRSGFVCHFRKFHSTKGTVYLPNPIEKGDNGCVAFGNARSNKTEFISRRIPFSGSSLNWIGPDIPKLVIK